MVRIHQGGLKSRRVVYADHDLSNCTVFFNHYTVLYLLYSMLDTLWHIKDFALILPRTNQQATKSYGSLIAHPIFQSIYDISAIIYIEVTNNVKTNSL